MLTIRFQRTGKRNQPHFRIVLIEHSRKVKGEYKELLGSYNPRSKETSLKKERILYWVGKGVKASPTVHNMLVSQGIISGPKVQAWKPKKSAKKAAETATAQAPAGVVPVAKEEAAS
ncbi:MAG: 30S ribosomal protein S16 [bacterium]|nr:30S ribosomal protein S16 [bacterium]